MIHTLLLVPAPGDPGQLLGRGPGGYTPPRRILSPRLRPCDSTWHDRKHSSHSRCPECGTGVIEKGRSTLALTRVPMPRGLVQDGWNEGLLLVDEGKVVPVAFFLAALALNEVKEDGSPWGLERDYGVHFALRVATLCAEHGLCTLTTEETP